jgi:4-amino-4-deoxy-L-arabinose transferase-like glycosyltransferase
VAWLVVLLPNLRIPTPSDALNYLQAAANFPDGLTDPDAPAGAVLTHQEVRFGLILPTRLAIEVFGYSQAAYYALPVLAVLILLVSVYALGSMLFSRAVGTGAAVLVLSATPILREQSYLMPDLISTALFTSAIAVCVAVRLRRLPRRWYVLAAIGVLLAWSYLVREFVVFGWALVPVLLWRRGWRAGLRDLAWVAGPMLMLWLAETALCWILYGDPLLRVKASMGHGGEPSLPGFAETYRDKPVLEYVFRLPEALQRYTEGRWLLALLALTIVGGFVQAAARLRRARIAARASARVSAPRRRVNRQAVALLLLWCAVIWVPLTLLGGVLDPSAPKLRLQLIRYWFPVFPAFILGGLGVVWLGVDALTRRWYGLGRFAPVLPAAAAIAVAAVPSVVSVEHLWGVPNTRAGGATHMDEFRDWMSRYEKTDAGRPVRSVWSDSRTDGLLRIFRSGPFGGQAWTAEVRAWRVDGPQPSTGDLVVAYAFAEPQARTDSRCADCRQAMAKVMEERAPRLGPVLFATRDGELRVQQVLAPSTGPPIR